MTAPERLSAIIAPLADAHGLILDGVEVTTAGKRRLVRVTLDRLAHLEDGWADAPTPPLGLDEVADVSREIDAALEQADPFVSAPYVLEVSSPGVGKPLREARQYQRNIGRLIEVTTAAGRVTGRVVRAGADEVEVSVADPESGGEGRRVFAYAAIERARVVVEFGRAQERIET